MSKRKSPLVWKLSMNTTYRGNDCRIEWTLLHYDGCGRVDGRWPIRIGKGIFHGAKNQEPPADWACSMRVPPRVKKPT